LETYHGASNICTVRVFSHVEVVEEVVGVLDEVVVGELIVARHRALPKINLTIPHPYRSKRGVVPETYYPVRRCTPEDGMWKIW
jgi:hypothetical protein